MPETIIDGGLNLNDPLIIGDREASISENIDFRKEGVARVRNGMTRLYQNQMVDFILTVGTDLYTVGPNVTRNGNLLNVSVDNPQDVNKIKLKDSEQEVLVIAAGTNLKVEGDIVYPWGIATPTSPPATSIGGGTHLTGLYYFRYTYIRKLNGVLIAESNPSPESAPVITSGQSVIVAVAFPSDEQVTHIRVYRTLANESSGSNKLYFDFDITLADNSGETSGGDADLGSSMNIDNDVPPIGITSIAGPGRYNRMFVSTGSRVHFSKGGLFESFPSTYYIDIGTPDDPVIKLVEWGGSIFIFTKEHIFKLLGDGPDTFVAGGTLASHGLWSKKGVAVTQFGIMYVSHDGIYIFNSQMEQSLTSKKVNSLFRGEIINGINPVNRSKIANSWLVYFDGMIFFGYPDATNEYPNKVLNYHISSKKFSIWNYHNRIFLNAYEDKVNQRLLVGDNEGKVAGGSSSSTTETRFRRIAGAQGYNSGDNTNVEAIFETLAIDDINGFVYVGTKNVTGAFNHIIKFSLEEFGRVGNIILPDGIGFYSELVALYHFNFTALDQSESENTHNGVEVNITWDSANEKLGSHCASFNGSSSEIIVTTHSDFDGDEDGLSISFWIKIDGGAPGSGEGMIAKRFKDIAGSMRDGWYILLHYATGLIDFKITDVGVNRTTITSSTNIDDGDYHHVVCNINNLTGVMEIWIDGVKEGTSSIADPPYGNEETLSIGKNPGFDGPQWFHGLMDEMVFIKRAITLQEIANMYNSGDGVEMGSVGTSSGAVSYPISGEGSAEFNDSVIDIGRQKLYMVGKTGSTAKAGVIVKIDLATFTEEVKLEVASSTCDEFLSCTMDPSGLAYIYCGCNTDEKIVRVITNLTGIGSVLTLNADEDNLVAMEIDPVNGFIYALSGSNSGRSSGNTGELIKVGISGFSRSDALEFGSGEKGKDMAIDVSNEKLYVVTTGTLIEVDLNGFTRGVSVTDVIYNNADPISIDPDRGFGYVGLGSASNPTVLKILLETMDLVESVPLLSNEYTLISSVIDVYRGFVYFGTGSIEPGQLIKLATSFSETLTVESGNIFVLEDGETDFGQSIPYTLRSKVMTSVKMVSPIFARFSIKNPAAIIPLVPNFGVVIVRYLSKGAAKHTHLIYDSLNRKRRFIRPIAFDRLQLDISGSAQRKVEIGVIDIE